MNPLLIPVRLIYFLLFTVALQSQSLQLIDGIKEGGGWTFDNGQEFPGATGDLNVAEETFQDQPVLQLKGNFTQGGNYVQAATPLPDAPIEHIRFWINVPAGANSIPIRLIDGTQQCHQLRLKLNDKGGWQKVTIPVEEYFEKMGTADALDLATQYQYWSGAKDARWHQPGKLFVVICGKGLGLTPEIQLSQVEFTPAAPKVDVLHTARLDDLVPHGETSWEFNPGSEYKGAKGNLEVIKSDEAKEGTSLRLSGNFTEGGAYVGMRKEFAFRQVKKLKAIRMLVRSKTTRQFSMRWVDGGKQTHQRKGIQMEPNGQWQELTFVPEKFVGAEHWGGANDGVWRGGVKLIEIMLNTRSNPDKACDLEISNIQADLVLQGEVSEMALSENFEDPLLWKGQGEFGIIQSKTKVMQLSRSLEKLTTATQVSSSLFPLNPGFWKVSYSSNSKLHSPDNSYHVQVILETLDTEGNALEDIPIGIEQGTQTWSQKSRTVQLPPDAVQGRLTLEMKKTYGTFLVDDITITRLKVQPQESSIERILLQSQAIGNLFEPNEYLQFTIDVEATKPLHPEDAYISYSIRDYWGTHAVAPEQANLKKKESGKGKFLYQTEIDLPDDKLQVGKFYQLHVEVPQGTQEPEKEFAGFAILNTSLAKGFPPEEIPFTIRNWDGRIPEYMRLADRLGFRLLGVWGGWSHKPPYKAHLPQVDLVNDLNALWITGTPAAQIEKEGFKRYTEESLRSGMQNFLEGFSDKGLYRITIGNEPHGTGEKVLENVRAYKAIYETVKAFDETIHVIGTSVEPNEEYFRAGYQNYLDSYDFHIYEHYTKVRKQMKEYRALMEKYKAVKPIHSTELGLNSQGQARRDVSREMIKKITSFFAEGGEMTSWFTIQYPDPKGKARGQFGDAHCMFDCKYNLYNPRLDAITHYHLINSVLDKKFVAEEHYPDGVQAYLFKNDKGECLQTLWLDGKRKDILLPLPPSVKHARLTYLDGTSQPLTCPPEGIHLTVSDDPILLTYHSSDQAQLPTSLPAPILSCPNPFLTIQPGETINFQLSGTKRTPQLLNILHPPLWTSTISPSTDTTPETLQIQASPLTPASEARVRIQEKSGNHVIGEWQIPIQINP